MKKLMNGTALVAVVCTIIFILLYRKNGLDIFLTLAITAGTISYHFVMRLFIGLFTKILFVKPINYHARWFMPKKFEKTLYERLKVKNWKDKMPTYRPEDFSMKTCTPEEIIQAMCISEIGHECMVILSFLPLFEIIWFGVPVVFWVTSLLAGGADCAFVMMQRYNRPRFVKLVEKRKKVKMEDNRK